MPERCRVTKIAGRTRARLDLLAERFTVAQTTTSYAEVIDDPDIDAVVVSTPDSAHVEWGIRSIQAGKHLMMQKPLSTKRDEITAFSAACEQAPNITVMCLPHFGAELASLRMALDDGLVGRPTGMRAHTSHGGPETYYEQIAALLGETSPTDLWFFDQDKAGGGALMDIGVYAVAAVVGVLGPIKSVTARLATIEKPTRLEDTASLILETDAGVIATAGASWCDPAITWTFSVHGSAGRLDFSAGSEPTCTGTRDLRPGAAPPEQRTLTVPAIGTAHNHWLDCVEAGKQPPVANAATAVHVSRVMLAAMTAAAERRTVSLAELLPQADAIASR